MPIKKILVTGGAGFIGSHVTDLLLSEGRSVVVLDCLEPQVHGRARKPVHLNRKATFLKARVQDRAALRRALKGVEGVIHLAAQVGVGQSMYEMKRYVDDNCTGTAIVLEELSRLKTRPKRLIVASSMSIYGEGAYRCPACGPIHPGLRPEAQLQGKDWEMRCPACGRGAAPEPTSESKPLAPNSVYAVSKRDQEELCLSVGRAYGIPTLAYRFFNVFGPRQSLSNPYTGVVAIFAGRLLNRKPPLVFEDGGQSRDFIHVTDIARAVSIGLERADVPYGVFNLGGGAGVSVLDVARGLARVLKLDIAPRVLGSFRQGDIRHCYADARAAREALGFSARVGFEEGLRDLLGWLSTQSPVDRVDEAYRELKTRGLAT